VTADAPGGHEKLRAVLIERFGEPSEPCQREVPRLDPREGEVLVEVRLACPCVGLP
jgi:D-arabinose 1-dehydrogenase-like Zn-dependent alcohol dehydrogenase